MNERSETLKGTGILLGGLGVLLLGAAALIWVLRQPCRTVTEHSWLFHDPVSGALSQQSLPAAPPALSQQDREDALKKVRQQLKSFIQSIAEVSNQVDRLTNFNNDQFIDALLKQAEKRMDQLIDSTNWTEVRRVEKRVFPTK